ncbi:MAG: hypothetical protein ISS70_06755 [Phycisphaerae bacterium]|nr:hypothetical protein [Phycisphaerae bacterium]
MTYKYLSCVSLVFLSSCTVMTHTAFPPEELTDLLNQNVVLLSDSLEELPPPLKENEIIFLGETHNVDPLIQAASRLAVYLATHRPVVCAVECCYGAHPLMEAVSLGNEKTINPMLYPETIRAFNSSQTAGRKILMTAIDLEHSIHHNKKETRLFLQELANRSTSDEARRIMQDKVAQLTAQDTYDKMSRYLKELKKLFLQHFDTFSSVDQDEILFSMELLVASNRYQSIRKDRQKAHPIRYRYFKKTIKRAYQKAQQRKAILLCRVGAAHVSLTDKNFEARYFAKEYSPTKGKVASIRLVPLYHGTTKADEAGPEKQSDIDSIVKMLMKDYEYSYLSLRDLQKNTRNSFRWSKYYAGGRPKYDGVLFVKTEEKSD